MDIVPDDENISDLCKNIKNQKITKMKEKAEQLENRITPSLRKTLSFAKDKGSSNWLNALPLEDEGYCLSKEEFRDAVSLRYDLPISGLPSKCPCSQDFDVTHAMNCKKGGFVHIRHNELRDLDASLLAQVCKDVAIEPSLLPLTGEILALTSANTYDNARLDIKARGFYRQGQTAFFDVRVVNVKAQSYINSPTEITLKKAENEKKENTTKGSCKLIMALLHP